MYDLVIIGASPEGLRAAQQSIKKFQTSRIALVTQGWETVWLAKNLTPKLNNPCFVETEPGEILRQLAALGVDVILESGRFKQRETGLVWQVSQRALTAKAYLLTTDFERYPITPLTNNNLFSPPENSSEAKNWGIGGDFPENLILAQHLAQQGQKVQLFTHNDHLLPGEDQEMSHLLQCYLESIGIKFWLSCQRITSHFNANSQTYQLSISDQVGSQNVTVDAFWRSSLPELPWHWLENLSDFQSEMESNSPYLAVNETLQTAHPQIFACGGWLKGYASPAIAIQESHYLVDRVLGKIQQAIDYAQIPFGIDLDPPWYRMGLNEQQAAARWGNIHVYHGYEAYQGNCSLRGFCKIITNPEDQIVGAHWFGASAKVGISLLTLVVVEGLTVETIQTLPVVDRGVAQVLQDLSPQ